MLPVDSRFSYQMNYDEIFGISLIFEWFDSYHRNFSLFDFSEFLWIYSTTLYYIIYLILLLENWILDSDIWTLLIHKMCLPRKLHLKFSTHSETYKRIFGQVEPTFIRVWNFKISAKVNYNLGQIFLCSAASTLYYCFFHSSTYTQSLIKSSSVSFYNEWSLIEILRLCIRL